VSEMTIESLYGFLSNTDSQQLRSLGQSQMRFWEYT